MESKLKALKVVDLKDILSKANVAITGKVNKQDLIAKILGSSAAIDVYNQNHGPSPAQPAQNASTVLPNAPAKSEAPQPPKSSAPPSSSQPTKAAPAPVTISKPAPQTALEVDDAPASTSNPSSITADTTVDPPKPAEDEEAERRRARAARFGIPLVDPEAAPAQKNSKAATNGKPAKGARTDDKDKLATRAARFGAQTPSAEVQKGNGSGRKRAILAAESVDEEELARRKKRAERFGTSLVGA